MTLLFTALALLSAVLHATWSALAYRFPDQAIGFSCMSAISVVVGVVLVAIEPAVGGHAVPFLAASVALHAGYIVALTRLNRLAQFSQLYPLSRGLSPVLIAIAAPVVARDRLSAGAVLGLGIVILGIVLVAGARIDTGRVGARSVGGALLVGLTIASYTVVDGLGVRAAASVPAFIGYLAIGQGILAPAIMVATGATSLAAIRREGRWARAVVVGGLSAASYALMIWAQTLGPLAVAAALRETSIVFATLIGIVVLREDAGARKLVAAGVIVLGIVVLQRAA
ncbi:DMT family transporter [Nocardioides pantholopis]|uniref:DMT family transporter n=1 Tax=Nocardioides pantholopis TaxID=2483798 RepID=UPI000F075808|nr:DMT family transporter [Nocardioides pantholopis]